MTTDGISRQRAWQLKKRAAGLCQRCGQPSGGLALCTPCAIHDRDRKGYKPWRLGGDGRPPKREAFRTQAETCQ